MTNADIEANVLELCAEDEFGSWELWWSVRAKCCSLDEKELRSLFVKTIGNLVDLGRLAAGTRSAKGDFLAAAFSRERLAEEIQHADSPEPDRSYWFHCSN